MMCLRIGEGTRNLITVTGLLILELSVWCGQELAKHGTRVLTTLGDVVQRLTDLDTLMPDLRSLCARHIKYGVEMEHYDILATACLRTMEVPPSC